MITGFPAPKIAATLSAGQIPTEASKKMRFLLVRYYLSRGKNEKVRTATVRQVERCHSLRGSRFVPLRQLVIGHVLGFVRDLHEIVVPRIR